LSSRKKIRHHHLESSQSLMQLLCKTSLKSNRLRMNHSIKMNKAIRIKTRNIIIFIKREMKNAFAKKNISSRNCWKIDRWSDAMIKVEMIKWNNNHVMKLISLFEKE
jgi:hypothetical protein